MHTGLKNIAGGVRVAVLALAAVPAGGWAQGVGLVVRAGVVASTPLVEDRVAEPRLGAALGGIEGARAVPGPALHLEVAAAFPMRARTVLEAALGWSFPGIDAEDGDGSRPIQDAAVGQATLSVLYALHRRVDVGCGAGVIRYFAERRALFAAGTEIAPLVECAARARVAGRPGREFRLRLAGQAHRFGTPVLLDAGARTGTVYRLAAQAELLLGGGR